MSRRRVDSRGVVLQPLRHLDRRILGPDRALQQLVGEIVHAGEQLRVCRTDIPEDFRIANTVVQVPVGATYLFVAAHDIYYSDNSDPDGDYGVRITPLTSVPETPTFFLLLAAMVAMFGVSFMKRSAAS